MAGLGDWKRKKFPKGIKWELKKLHARLFCRVNEKKLAQAISRLNIPAGAVVGVHSMLSGLGYIVGGPQTVIKAIQRAVPNCTVFMPTFPFSGSMKEYLDGNPAPFSVDETPSKSGVLTETLRLMPGARRSFHPTHSCAALGPRAEGLLNGSEYATTPFGDESAYGRFCRVENSYLLLIHTNNASIVHRVQEMVAMPGLFFDEPHQVKGIGADGAVTDYAVKVHRPRTPLFVAVPSEKPDKPSFMWFPDYALLFPQYNRARILKTSAPGTRRILLEREKFFNDKNICRKIKINESEILAVDVNAWLPVLNKDVQKSLVEYKEFYEKADLYIGN